MAIEPITLHEDSFHDFFRPYRHPATTSDCWGGLGLETFGSDLNIVRQVESRFLWTVTDGEAGRDSWILPGIHTVNRVCYLITERAHDWIPASFKAPSPPYSLTTIGLSRQLRRIEKLLSPIE